MLSLSMCLCGRTLTHPLLFRRTKYRIDNHIKEPREASWARASAKIHQAPPQPEQDDQPAAEQPPSSSEQPTKAAAEEEKEGEQPDVHDGVGSPGASTATGDLSSAASVTQASINQVCDNGRKGKDVIPTPSRRVSCGHKFSSSLPARPCFVIWPIGGWSVSWETCSTRCSRSSAPRAYPFSSRSSSDTRT